jgi:hypothetical protein
LAATLAAGLPSDLTVAPHLSGRPGAEVIFTNGTGIEVDETVADIEALL